MKTQTLFRHFCKLSYSLVAALTIWTLIGSSVGASTLWNGPIISYSQPGSDPTQAANQDRITGNVWLTRASFQGLFNARTESSYTHFFSPADTEWAYGTLANYASLTYSTWEAWNGHNPPSMVGRDAVLHLVSDDTYLSIKFTFWGGISGGFSYDRSTPVVPEPSPALVVLTGLVVAGASRFIRFRLDRRLSAVANCH